MRDLFRLIDTHTHITGHQFDHDRAHVLQRAHEAGVARIIEIGYDLPTSYAAVAVAEAHPHIFAVVGLQPNHIHETDEGWLEEVRTLANHPKVVAIGEIGLDYHWMKVAPEVQETVFRTQIDLARQLGLPVVIHSREAHADTLRILNDAARGVPGVMHSFSGDWAFAQACLEIDFMLSLSGPLTFSKAHELHEVVRRAPATMLLTETDSPYLTPHPHRGKRNEPAYVRFVAEQMAQLRGVTLEEMAEQVWANAERVFGFG
ncbi:TatD family hydrolase [Candidatus Oscillochloris fontis]|uniref:TatD family hydrolase n=1 Tax=Candidatus Oscillochloris fontis TaxID=2496868 RepID=UPI001EE909EC|nr:TatD family hydrolase [Candidatus Oscillochloris fontis]